LDYRSPAIDSGIDVGITTDYSGNYIYGSPDIGAYEYQPTYIMGTNQVSTSTGIRIYGDSKFKNNSATSSDGTADLLITIPGSDKSKWLDVTISSWLNNSTYHKTWVESTTASGVTNTIHAIGDLDAEKYYRVKVDSVIGQNITGDNCNNGICLSNSSGKIYFTYTGAYSTHTFDVESATYILNYSAGSNGSISGISSQTVDYGSSGSPVTAIPSTGYHFVNWSDGSTANPRSDINVTSNISVTANFEVNNVGAIIIPISPMATLSAEGRETNLDFVINNNDPVTTSPKLSIKLNGDPQIIKYYAISLDPEFGAVSLTPYSSSDISFSLPNQPGNYTVYLKYYSTTGHQSNRISHSIEYRPTAEGVKTGENGSIPGKQSNQTKDQETGKAKESKKYYFSRNLYSGMIHEDVKELQKYLNANGFSVAVSGPGSSGNETTKFGRATRNALIKFQVANKIKPAIGYFGPVTRRAANGER
jgi:hypothetical protein